MRDRWCCRLSFLDTNTYIDIVQFLSHGQLFETPCTTAHQDLLSHFTISWCLLKLIPIELMIPSKYLILCSPLLLLPSIFPNIRVFSNESGLHIRWPKYWSFSISPSNECSGLISCMIGWFELLAVQETPKSLLLNHSSKAPVPQLSLLYGPTLTSIHDYWKNHSFD